jgi:hypothetical protein
MKTCQARMVSLLDFPWCRPGRASSTSRAPIYTPVLQIAPTVPFDVLFNLTAPDGSKRTAQARGTVSVISHPLRSGRWTSRAYGFTQLTPPGTASKAGSRTSGSGYIFVLENGSPGGPGMALNLSLAADLLANRRPGDSREQQRIRGVFCSDHSRDPKKVADKIRTYDIINLVNGKPKNTGSNSMIPSSHYAISTTKAQRTHKEHSNSYPTCFLTTKSLRALENPTL